MGNTSSAMYIIKTGEYTKNKNTTFSKLLRTTVK
jgi:hypothetical protein